MNVAPGSARPGERITLSTVNPELDDGATVRSSAFAKAVELKPTGKVSWEAHARIRCDAEPGTYSLHFAEPVHPGEDTLVGKVTVEAGEPIDGSKCAEGADGEAGGDDAKDDDGSHAMAIGIAGGAVVAAAAVTFLVVRRMRRR
ncbi:hypothetical protein [Streptomyces sp. NPDC059063]|uniref:hypothetical protein n=1 Tax=unclassified Streptomyces TaxID=2593676 RepID=UPI0036C17C83